MFSQPPGLQLGRIRFYASIVAAVSAVTVGGIAGFAVSGATRLAILLIAALGGVLGVLRAQRLDFLLGDRGVIVRNYWRTYEFAWSDVELVRLAFLRVGVVPQTAIAFFLRDQRPVLVQATPLGSTSRASAFDAIAEHVPPGTHVGAEVSR